MRARTFVLPRHCGVEPDMRPKCSLNRRAERPVVAAFGFDERTVAAWRARTGRQGQAVQEYLVEQPRDLGQVQADERRVKHQGGIVWMALAMMVKTRLWLAGEVSEHRIHSAHPAADRVGTRLCLALPVVVLYRWAVCLHSGDSRDLSRSSPYRSPRASSVAPLAEHLHRPSRETVCPAVCGRRRAPYR
jgi:hypothetical protein